MARRAEDQGKHIVTLLLLPNIPMICSQGTSLLLPPSKFILRHHCCQVNANSDLSEQAEGEGSLSVFQWIFGQESLKGIQQCLAAIGLVPSQKTLGRNAAGALSQPVQLPSTETTQLETIKSKLSYSKYILLQIKPSQLLKDHTNNILAMVLAKYKIHLFSSSCPLHK